MNFKRVLGTLQRFGVLAALLIGISVLSGGSANAQGTTFTWTNVGGGNFELATNWTPTGVPGPNDTAVFNSNLTYTVNGSRTVNSIVIAGSTVAFTGNVTTSNLSVTTSGGGLIVFSGNFTLNGPGNIASGSILTLTGGSLSGTGLLTVDGTANWANTGIFLNTVISAGATMSTTGSGDHGFAATLTNRGTFNFTGGRITNGAGPGGQFRNENLVDVQTDGAFQFLGNTPNTFLNTATGTLRKTGGTGNLDFNGFPLTNAGTIEVQSGRIRMFNDLMNTGTLTVTGGSQVFEFGNSNSTLSTGTHLTGTGRFQLSNANLIATADVSVPNLDLSAGTLSGTGTVTATNNVSWSSTFILAPFVVEAGTTMTTVGAVDHRLAAALTNRGTFNYTMGRITNGGGSGGQFRNENLVDVQTDGAFQFVGNGPTTFLNTATGTLRKSGGTGNLDFNGFPLTNAGTIDVQSGRIRIFNDLMNTGTLTVTGGTQVFEFGNSNSTLSTGTQLTGTGRFQLSNANLIVTANVSVPNLDLAAGTLSGTGTMTATNSVFWTSTFITAPFVVESGATMTTAGSVDHGLAATLTNRGTFNFTGGRITNGAGNGGQFRNENLVDVQTDGAFQFVGNSPTTFLNSATGTLRKSDGTGNLDFNGFPLTNAGMIDVQSGRIRMFSDLMNTGTLTVTGGTQVFEFGNSNTTLSAGTTLTGNGRFQLSNANVNVTANVDVPNLDLAGGNLNGTATMTVTGSGNWTSSQVNGSLVVAPGVTLNLVGTNDRGLSGSLTNRGTVSFSGGRITNGGGAGLFRNESVFDATADVSVVYIGGPLPSFINGPTGLIRKTGGTGPLTVNWDLTNQGTIDCPRDFRVNTYVQTTSGILNVDIGGTTQVTQYDRLQTNSVTLNGTLNLSVSNGFQPALGQTFDIVTYNGRTGTFPTVNGKNQGPVAFDPVYQANSLRLNVINSPCPTITLDPQTIPGAVNGVAYNQTVTATGGTAPYGFVVSSGSLPTGLTLSSAGVISGTPTANGSFSFQITVTDANGCTATINYTLNVACPTITLSPATLPNGSVGAMYSQTITASGGLGTYTFMPVSGTLPPGLVLSAAGVLAGMPTSQGTFQFTVRATDTVTNCFGERNYTVIIGCPTITLSGLGNGTVGSPYSQSVIASGGAAPYSYALTSGTLPTGLSIASSGAVTGTPTATGNFTFMVTATDANGCTGSGSFTVNIGCQSITVNPATLPDGNIGVAYSQTVSASNTQGTVSFSVTSGSLPTGLTLNGGTGAMTGTPTANGTFDFTITATDGNGCTGSRGYTVVITCPTITLSGLPNATVGSPYSQTITASGGTSPYSFSLASGSLPTGLSLDQNGTVSGTPTTAGSFTFTVTATDARGCTGTRSYTVVANCQFVTLSPATLPSATVGSPYSQTISATGGSAPYTFAVTNGTLPATFTLSTGGVLSGNPSATGSATFTVTATDTNGCTGALVYTLTINPAGACTFTVTPQSLSFPSSGGIGQVTVTTDAGCAFTTSGAPTWITGLAPTGTGTQVLTFTVAANNDATPRTATLTIAGQTVTVSQDAAVNLNNLVRLSVISQRLLPSNCAANGYAGDFEIQATLTNIGRSTIYHGAFLLTQLRPANGSTPAVPFRLISADGATCTTGGLPGALQTVNLGAGLAPGESVTITFTLALSTIQRTIFNVEFQGGSDLPVARANHPRATPSSASQISGGVVDFFERSAVENRKENGFDLTLDTNFVLPRREVSKPSGL